MNKHFHLAILFACTALIQFACDCNIKDRSIAQQKQTLLKTNKSLQSICFGSCNKQWEDQNYWTEILQENPDLWIWMGDIIYCDTEDMGQMAEQYQKQKRDSLYQVLQSSSDIIGIWDDHDYGVNDGGKDYPKKKESRELLFDFLDVAENNQSRKREGAYQSYTYGPEEKQIKLILLDGRYFRDNLQPDHASSQRYLPNESGTYLGEKQWLWLEKELINSSAKLNIIVSGIQVIPTEHDFEKWANFPAERNRLFDLLIATGRTNSLFISGDRHIGEYSRLEYKNITFHEITSSGLTHSYEKAEEENPYRVGQLIKMRNYGILKLDLDDANNSVSFSIKEFGKENSVWYTIDL